MTGLGALLADYEQGVQSASGVPVAPRPVILNDLSPAACHITENYNSVADPAQVAEQFSQIAAKTAEVFQSLYAVEHYQPAAGAYDPRHPEVAARLKSEASSSGGLLDDGAPRDWELISRAEVESRLGFPFSELNADSDCSSVEQWLAIPATLHYAVWSDVFLCQGLANVATPTGKVSKRGANAGAPIVKKTKVSRGCGGLINLWACAVDKSTGDVLDTFSCPHCKQVWSKLQLSRSHSEPVELSYRFNGFKMLKKGISQARVSGSRPIGQQDAAKVKKIAELKIPESFKDESVDLGREMMRHGLLKRGVQTIADFYTHRNLYALAMLWGEILKVESVAVRKKLQFCFTSQVMRASRLRRMRPFGPGEQLSGTLYIAALTVETNVLNLLTHAVSEYCETFPRWMLKCPHQAFVRTGSATELGGIPAESVDFIFTDPPFGKNIFYADCAMLWENWLGARTNEQKELVVNERRTGGDFKTLEKYGKLMADAFSEMFRVLKPGRFALVEFNNSDGAVFDVVKRAIAEAGFQIEGMFVFDKGVKTFKQLKGTNQGEAVVDKDVMFTLAKPSVASPNRRSEDYDLEHQLADAVREYLQNLPERIKAEPGKYNDEHRTTATINSMLMNALIPRGVNVERLNLPFIERVCSRYFRKVGNRWYLRGEAVGGSSGNGFISEEITVKDEVSASDWLRQKLSVRPMMIGELKPLWMRATGLLPAALSQSLILDFLLGENFWRDPDTNRWREPTDEERERMNDDRSIRVLHDAERYLGGSLARQTTDDERCRWIEVLYKACRDIEEKQAEALPALRGFEADEAYRVITRLFQSVLKEHVTPDIFRRAEKQYKAASNKIASQVEQEKEVAKAKNKDANQTTMDLGI